MDGTIELVKVLKQAGASDDVVVRALLLLGTEKAPATEPAPAPGSSAPLVPAAVQARGFAQVKFSPFEGKSTNVVVPVPLMQALVRRTGSRQAAYEEVRRVARTLPWSGRRRSQRVCEALQRTLDAA